jgi:hypothetical protein
MFFVHNIVTQTLFNDRRTILPRHQPVLFFNLKKYQRMVFKF